MRTIPSTLPERGRIRIGDMIPVTTKDGKDTFRQHKLGNFRLTSADAGVLEEAAALYGGTVQRWDGPNAPTNEHGGHTQWELYTESNSLQVVVPSLLAVDISYERWVRGARGCILRCDGNYISRAEDKSLLGLACLCPLDDRERAALAKERGNKACQRILRLKVLLPELSGLGVWRLQTMGHYATAELNGTLALLQSLGAPSLFRAVLRLEERTQKGEDEHGKATTFQFAVPVLVPTITPRELLAARGPASPLTLAASNADAADLYGDHAGNGLVVGSAEATEDAITPTERLAQIEAALTEAGLNSTSYWARICGHFVVEQPRHLTSTQLLTCWQRLQGDLARRPPVPVPAQAETTAGDDNDGIPF